MGSLDPLSDSLIPEPRAVPLSSWVLRMERYYNALQNPPARLWRELLAEGSAAWRRWVQKGLFHRIQRPLIFFYRQRFRTPEGEKERLGLWAAFRCRDEAKRVLPHEGTFEEGRRFYAHLYRTLRVIPDPVHLLTSAPFEIFAEIRERLASSPPLLRFQDSYEELHELWPLENSDLLNRFEKEILVVADGHHRWEASLLLAREGLLRSRPVVLTSVHDPGLLILPTHRLLKGPLPERAWKTLADLFEIQPEDQIQHPMLPSGTLVWISREGLWRLQLRAPHRQDPRPLYTVQHSLPYSKLETALLHEVLLPRLSEAGHPLEVAGYERHVSRALEHLEAGKIDHVVVLPPTPPQSVMEVARSGEKMPQKSTDFYPKLVAGLVLTPL